MSEIWIGPSKFSPRPTDLFGEGGEAEIYKVDANTVLKLYKGPSHVQFQGNSAASAALRKAAELRLADHQRKLPAFPANLPSRVVAPAVIARESAATSAKIVGYSMPMIHQGHSLREYSQRAFRETGGIKPENIVEIFLDLHETVTALHKCDVVIGDFNPMNVLIANKQAHLLDADSMQFANFFCSTYCANYVDPLICAPNTRSPEMVHSHNKQTDWYAFAILFWECLLYAHPYGGVYKPASPVNRIGPRERPLKRISVLHAEVKYPVAAMPVSYLPDAIVDFYRSLLIQDERIPFPPSFLEDLKFQNNQAFLVQRFALASTAAQVSANDSTAKGCAGTLPPEARVPALPSQSITPANFDHPGVTCRSVFSTAGQLLYVVLEGRKLRYIYHQDGRFFRESGIPFLNGNLDPAMRFRIHKESTIVARGSKTWVLESGTDPLRLPTELYRGVEAMFDANEHDCFWTEGGYIWHRTSKGDRQIDEVVAGQTRITVGPTFGFGYYQAGDFRRGFLFDRHSNGKCSVDITSITGTLLDTRCLFTESSAWLLTTVRETTRILNRCTLIDRAGRIIASAQCDEGEDSWLGKLTGKCAGAVPSGTGGTIDVLFAATENGIVQIGAQKDQLVVPKAYAGTDGLAQPDDNLLFSRDGLYVWNRQTIKVLTPGLSASSDLRGANMARNNTA